MKDEHVLREGRVLLVYFTVPGHKRSMRLKQTTGQTTTSGKADSGPLHGTVHHRSQGAELLLT